MYRKNILCAFIALIFIGTENVTIAAEKTTEASQPDEKTAARAAALAWLQKSEAAMGRVERIPPAFHEEEWAHWMVQSYLDLGRSQDALAFVVRFQQHFEMAFVRSGIRFTSYQLACEGKFKEAHEVGQLLYTGIPANPHVRQHDVYVDLLIDLAALEARAGDFPRALRTARLIPADRNQHWAKARADAFGFIALGYARAGDLKGLQQIEREFAPRDNDTLQAGRLVLATELAKAGAFAAAEQVAEPLPATMRDAFVAGEALELALAGKMEETKAALAKLPRSEQRQAAWQRIIAAVAFSNGREPARELCQKVEELEPTTAESLIEEALAWTGKPDEAPSSDVLGEAFPGVEGWEQSPATFEIGSQWSLHKAFPRRTTRPGGVDPFSPPAVLEIDDYDFKATLDQIKELNYKNGDQAALAESLKYLSDSVPPEEFRKQVDLYTALAVVANVAGDKAQAAAFAESAMKAAERIDFKFCGSHSRVLFPVLINSGRGDLALTYLRRLLVAETHEQFPAAKVAHVLAMAGEQQRIDEVLTIVADDAERAAVCLGAARGCIAMAFPTRELPLVGGEWELIEKLKITDEQFPWSEWDDRRTGYRGDLGQGYPLWLEPKTWPNVPRHTPATVVRSIQEKTDE